MNDNFVKLVSYRLFFVKPDLEESDGFIKSDHLLVDYATSAEQLGSQIILQWVKDVQEGRVTDPDTTEIRKLIQNRKNWRYLRVTTEVLERYPQEEKYYERRQTRAQESLAAEVGRLTDRVG